MDEDFTKIANTKRIEYLIKTEELFVSNKEKWFVDFTGCFQDICAQIRKMQDDSVLSVISYLEYLMLYTNFIKRHYIADIFVFGKKCYLDKNQLCIGVYDVSYMFVFFDKLWDDLLMLKKRYVGKISAKEITTYMLQTLPDFYSYLSRIARTTIMEYVEEYSLDEIVKNEEFTVKSGSYMARTEPVYAEKKNKDTKELTEWFSEQLNGKYYYGDYSRLNFSGKSFLFTDFLYARFSGSSLQNTNFEGSILYGTNFRNANMENCCLDHCIINGADFSNANLKKTSFVKVKAKAGLPNEQEWEFPGFLPVSFRYADLTSADFTGANLTGADFTGAVLTDTNFTDTVLDDAIFNGCIGREV